MQEKANELIFESSPYLLQHAYNPVHWYAWGDKALQKAKDENKLLIISIGYAACHWCHVMEHESYEDEVVAQIMNNHFVCIKVDREERPDVDQVYMNAAILTSGSGGWPLNAFALSDGRPFYAGTYFPNHKWLEVMDHFIQIHENNPALLIDYAEKVTNGIQNSEIIELVEDKSIISLEALDTVFELWKRTIDFKKGGEGRSPKFPMPANWEYLLHYYHESNNPKALEAVNITLTNMAIGGIYDHLGGGFARYSTDMNWHVPHFEKMLYDNAQLIGLYSHAFQLTKNPLYKIVVFETLEFIEREMTSDEGGFYSSLDADSEGIEGQFYVWKADEIDSILGDSSTLFKEYYNVTSKGNWEHGNNILFKSIDQESIVETVKKPLHVIQDEIEKSKRTLLKYRNERIRPGLDDKILTSWNALMLKGYIQAYRVFDEKKFLQSALKSAHFLTENLLSNDSSIKRNFKNGKATISGFLDDYAFTISAFIELYIVTSNESWLYKAKEMLDYTIIHFFDTVRRMFYYTNDQDSALIVRKMEIADNVIPSSNSEMAKNLFYLAHYFASEDYLNKASQMLRNVQDTMCQNIFYYANWGTLAMLLSNSVKEVAMVGDDCDVYRKAIDKHYLPHIVLYTATDEGSLPLLKNKLQLGKTTMYVCKDKACKLPSTDINDILKELI